MIFKALMGTPLWVHNNNIIFMLEYFFLQYYELSRFLWNNADARGRGESGNADRERSKTGKVLRPLWMAPNIFMQI